ncbi:Flagellar basal body-associated protein FliL [Sulfitobacter noctilucae]|uniref:flagellar basal body-associated FliL family protein n=1 Tax=Sulfitobacter noctilucae TaxID=1342302 RepID=UPI0004681E8A|nr:flagellar basal body-associated FliL family protein [Sulfitobacter noctilucae]KIN65937.1 Flagellar basal body-associated protein FliL [Sulfitobacter noctilucae]
MPEADTTEDEKPKKASKLPLIIGLVLALAGGGGGFYATWSGMILGDGPETAEAEETLEIKPGPDVSYVDVDPLVISMRAPSNANHLMFRATLEVPALAQETVEKLLPRVIDVLNSYLRALEPRDLEDPAALTRLRAQMLRRVQVVAGADNIKDLLIMEFVLN